MSTKEELINRLDDLLPQTQCGLCNYEACRPYAAAIINNKATINRCLPGGIETLINIAAFLGQDLAPHDITEMQKKARPLAVAIIREEECIGCTKCIQACPTDAIVGASKLMHTIITNACTGCEQCLPPCPMDCIEIKTLPSITSEEQKYHAHEWRSRYEKRQKRLERHRITQQRKHQALKLASVSKKTLEARQEAIRAAVARVNQKKCHEPK